MIVHIDDNLRRMTQIAFDQEHKIITSYGTDSMRAELLVRLACVSFFGVWFAVYMSNMDRLVLHISKKLSNAYTTFALERIEEFGISVLCIFHRFLCRSFRLWNFFGICICSWWFW